jgi:hypothetical protein
VPCPACNDLAHPRLPPDWISLASVDDPPAPTETILFAVERDGQIRSCRLLDLGPYGVKARLCDGDVDAGFFAQRFVTMGLARVGQRTARRDADAGVGRLTYDGGLTRQKLRQLVQLGVRA